MAANSRLADEESSAVWELDEEPRLPALREGFAADVVPLREREAVGAAARLLELFEDFVTFDVAWRSPAAARACLRTPADFPRPVPLLLADIPIDPLSVLVKPTRNRHPEPYL